MTKLEELRGILKSYLKEPDVEDILRDPECKDVLRLQFRLGYEWGIGVALEEIKRLELENDET